MQYVLHSSVAVRWVLPQKGDDRVALQKLRPTEDDIIVVPAFWSIEVTNILLHALREDKIDVKQLDEYRTVLSQIPLKIDNNQKVGFFEALDLADHFHISTFEAVYLELAQRHELPLAVMSSHLRQAAAKISIPLLPA